MRFSPKTYKWLVFEISNEDVERCGKTNTFIGNHFFDFYKTDKSLVPDSWHSKDYGKTGIVQWNVMGYNASMVFQLQDKIKNELVKINGGYYGGTFNILK